MGEHVLRELGVPASVAADHVRRFREHDEMLLREQYLVYDDDAAVRQSARQARADLLQLFDADEVRSADAGDADTPRAAD